MKENAFGRLGFQTLGGGGSLRAVNEVISTVLGLS